MELRNLEEKRQQQRFPVSWRFEGKEFSLAGLRQEARKGVVRGQIHDISATGFGLFTERPLSESEILRCGILPPGSSVAIPTLAQVRWVVEEPEELRFSVGLQFLV